MSERTSTFSINDDRHKVAERCTSDPELLASVIDALSGESRRMRQFAADIVHEVSLHEPAILKPHVAELADALHRPESQTRWEVLGVFDKLIAVDARLVDRALAGAEAALHDEESGTVRLAAFRVLAHYGSTTERRSERVWPLIAEAVRCYHGDSEFPAMLSSLYRLTSGASSDEVKLAAAELMTFDSEFGKGLLKRRASRIVACAPKRRGKKKTT